MNTNNASTERSTAPTDKYTAFFSRLSPQIKPGEQKSRTAEAEARKQNLAPKVSSSCGTRKHVVSKLMELSSQDIEALFLELQTAGMLEEAIRGRPSQEKTVQWR